MKVFNFLQAVGLIALCLVTSVSQAEMYPDDDQGSNGGYGRSSLHWKDYRGYIPDNAVPGGGEGGRVLYVCQAPYAGGVQPGKVVDGNCNITWGGREIIRGNFRILVGGNYYWKKANAWNMPRNAVKGGFERGAPLYICQASYSGGVHPGKIFLGKCDIGYGGAEIPIDRYRVLVKGERWPVDNGNDYDNNDNDDNGGEIGNVPGNAPSPGSAAPATPSPLPGSNAQ